MDTKKIMLKKNAITDLRGRKHVITQDRSQFLIDNFKKNRSRIISTELKKKDDEVGILPFSECFNAKAVRKLLDLPNCEGLRIYSGLNDDFQLVFVLRAVDENGNDILQNLEKPLQKTAGTTMMAMSFMPAETESFNLDDAQRVPPWPETNNKPLSAHFTYGNILLFHPHAKHYGQLRHRAYKISRNERELPALLFCLLC